MLSDPDARHNGTSEQEWRISYHPQSHRLPAICLQMREFQARLLTGDQPLNVCAMFR